MRRYTGWRLSQRRKQGNKRLCRRLSQLDLRLFALFVAALGADAALFGRDAAKLIDVRLVELAGADLVLKEHVQLGKGASLGLGQAEVAPDEEDDGEAGPEEGGEGTPVPLRRQQHLRHEHVVQDRAEIVQVAREHDGLDLHPRGRDLRHEGVADRTDRDIVHEGVDENERANRPAGRASAAVFDRVRHVLGLLIGGGEPLRNTGTADGDKNDNHHANAPDVDLAPANVTHHEPGENGADRAHAVLANAHVECAGLAQAGPLQELDGVAHQRGTTVLLGKPDDAGDFGTSSVDAAETLQVGC